MTTTPTEAWTIGDYVDTAQPLPDTAPTIPTFTPGEQATDEQLTAVVQHLAVAADQAGLQATWHSMDPTKVGEYLITTVRLPNGRVMDIHPRVSRHGQLWFHCSHWTPDGIWIGDWDTIQAYSVAEVLTIARVWTETPPA